MDHPMIVTAFVNALQRKDDNIYMTFERKDIFYKDTYCILSGNQAYVQEAIQNAYFDVKEERDSCPRADHNNLLDTPFDSWCSGACMCDNIRRCADAQVVKCGSRWTYVEHDSLEDQLAYIRTITPGYYGNVAIEIM